MRVRFSGSEERQTMRTGAGRKLGGSEPISGPQKWVWGMPGPIFWEMDREMVAAGTVREACPLPKLGSPWGHKPAMPREMLGWQSRSLS